MTAVVAALAPIFLLIVIGLVLRRRSLVPDGFWAPAEMLTFYVFFPALLIDSTARADLSGIDVVGVGGALLGGTLVAALLLLLLRPWVAKDGPAFTSVFQGATRINTYVGIAAATALYGVEGKALIAVGIIAIVPLLNVMAVLVLARWGRAGVRGWRPVLRALVRNPLLGAVLIGLTLNVLSVPPIPVVTPLLQILGAAALPLGLLAVGAGLDLGAMRGSGPGLVWSSLVRLALVPGIVLALGIWTGLGPVPLAVAVLYNGLPTSAASYVQSRLMGGDHGLMAGIITFQTLAAAATLPLWLLAVTAVS
ncbi:MAG: hypothetical protein RLY86_3389 [Pseudomonadota bacterium]|jgi:predicted permease